MFYAMKAADGNLSVIQNTCPNPAWFEEFMKTYTRNLEKGEGTYFCMKLLKTGYGVERMFYTSVTESKFHNAFKFIGEENPRKMIQITTK